jgi:hypothetical protein
MRKVAQHWDMPPSPEEEEDVLLACRYGDIDDVRIFVETYGALALEGIRDEHQNTVFHMLCANGHDGQSVNQKKHPPQGLNF